MKVLIIDDDEALSAIFATAMQKDGIQVVTAANAKSGLDKAKTEKPDLILLDQILPDIAGNDVLKILKEDQQTQPIAVAMLSNFGQNELVKEAINAGAVEYILKYQIEPQDLVNRVKGITKT